MPEHVIDLRSDTVTKPSAEMRRAMAEAEVGDDVFGDDPTVIALEERAAEITGKEAALFVASGTMGNLVSLMAQVPRGGEIIAGEGNHSFAHEAANHAVVVGAGMRLVPSTAPPPGNPARGRVWVWGAAVVALVIGVAMALARPDASEPEKAPAAAAAPSAPPGPVAPAPLAASPREETGAVEARAPKRADSRGNRSSHAKVDRTVTHDAKRTPSAVVPPGPATRTSDEALRGALPSRSGEGYPDPP